MCEASKIIILKKGDMISEEEVFVLKKSSEILSEIRERKVKWKKVNWIGNKPEYEWFVLGFSSDICMEGEDIPAILLLHMGEEKDYQEMDQFNVASTKYPQIVYNSVTGSSEAIASVIRKTREMYGSNSKFCIFRKRV